MPRKKTTAVATVGSTMDITGLGSAVPDFSNVLGNAELTLAEKRKKVLMGLGLRKTKKVYASPAERKAAAKERAKKRREAKLEVLKKYGLEPHAKGPKKSKEEKKAVRKERALHKREFLREMAKADPERAKQFGIDVTRFRAKK